MGIKKVKNLKTKGLRIPAMEWEKNLNLTDLTTREWELAAELAALLNMGSEEIREVILAIRKYGWKWGQSLLGMLYKRK